MKKSENSRKKDENMQAPTDSNQQPEHTGDFEALNDQDKNNPKNKPLLVVPVDHTHLDYPKEDNVRQQDSNDESYLGNRGGYKKSQSHHRRDFNNTGRPSENSSRGKGDDSKKKKNRY